MWTLEDIEDDTVELMDDSELLNEEDLVKPDPASLRVCGTTGGNHKEDFRLQYKVLCFHILNIMSACPRHTDAGSQYQYINICTELSILKLYT